MGVELLMGGLTLVHSLEEMARRHTAPTRLEHAISPVAQPVLPSTLPARMPQSAQSVPSEQMLNSAPGPPSSQSPSEA